MKTNIFRIMVLFSMSSLLGYGQIVINEINYNSAPDFDPEDWVELYNFDDDPVDVSNWVFKDDDNANEFIIPSGTIMNPGTYLVLTKDLTAFQALFPSVSPVIGDMDFGLSKKGELVRLYDAAGVIVDQLEYDDKAPWPEEPDGDGNSLELINALLDNTLPESWEASVTASAPHGTPGAQNSTYEDMSNEELIQIDFTIYPNPVKDEAFIRLQSDIVLNDSFVHIYNILGKEIITIPVTSKLVKFNRENLNSGIYMCKVSIGGKFYGSKKIIVY
jgi:hypothetical protein